MSKILITGGDGFVGKKTAKILSQNGYDVICFDILPSNEKERENLPYKKFWGSILNPYDIDKAIDGCETVIHLAALVGVKSTEQRRLECLHINIRGTTNVLDAAVKHKIKKIIFSSSSEVYGDQEKFPTSENASLKPKSNYGISKIAAEEYVMAYQKFYNLKFNICRFFNIYGSGQKEEFVIPKFAKLIKSNEAIKVYGDGKQIRSYCHVDDAVDGIAQVLKSGKDNTVYNIGNDNEPISVFDLATKMVKISKKQVKIEKVPFEKSDRTSNREIYRRQPNIEKLKKDTNYIPKIKLDSGIEEVLTNKLNIL